MKLSKQSIFALLVFVSMSVSLAIPAQAQGSPDLVLAGFICDPATCSEQGFGFSTTSVVSVAGVCGDINTGLQIGFKMTISAIDCLFIAETEVQASGGNQIFLDDCGNPYQLGQISALGQIFNSFTFTRLYVATGSRDCAGGESASPPVFTGC